MKTPNLESQQNPLELDLRASHVLNPNPCPWQRRGVGLTTATRTRSKKRRGGSEREYAVFVNTLKKSEETPEIKAYGEVKSWRSLEVRSPVGGKISEVSKIFRDGAVVQKGDFLFSIDDQEYRDKLTIANADLRDATSDLENAKMLVFKGSQNGPETVRTSMENRCDLQKAIKQEN